MPNVLPLIALVLGFSLFNNSVLSSCVGDLVVDAIYFVCLTFNNSLNPDSIVDADRWFVWNRSNERETIVL